MNFHALGLIVLSAFAHAGWNYLAKASGDKHVFFWSFIALGSLLYLPAAVYFASRTTFTPEACVYLVGTAVLHIVYFQLLKQAYTHADLSIAYPVSRGTGLVLIAIIGIVLLKEKISLPAIAAIATIVAGIVVMHLRTAEQAAAAPFWTKATILPLLVGLTIAAYSVWDKKALNDTEVHPLLLGEASFLGQAVVNGFFVLGRRNALRTEIRVHWKAIVAAAILAPGSYLLILIALSLAESKVSYIAPSRELGIVIGVLLGRFLLKEAYSPARLIGSLLIVAGVFALALVP